MEPLLEPEVPSDIDVSSDNVVHIDDQKQPEVTQIPANVENTDIIPEPVQSVVIPTPDPVHKVPETSKHNGEQVLRRSQRVRKPNPSLDPAVWDLNQMEISGEKLTSILLAQNQKLINLLAIQVTSQHRGGGDN